MQAIFLCCGAGGPQLKRSPLDRSTPGGRIAHRYRFLLVILAAPPACVSRSERAAAYVAPNFLAYFAVSQRCPLPGLSVNALRVSLGEPARFDTTGTSVIWRYHVGSDREDLLVLADSQVVRSWSIEGLAPATVRAWAMTRGCPQPGMTAEEVRTTVSHTRFMRNAIPSAMGRTYLTYPAGIEGQKIVFLFQDDTLTAARYCGGTYQVAPCP